MPIAVPSLRVEPQYVTQVVVTEAGRVYSGLLVAENDQQIQLKIVRGNDIETIAIERQEIEDQMVQPTSLMPERMLRDMTAQQAADLIDFLVSLRNPTETRSP